jgi:cyanophycinase-like exopeptidase
VADVSPTPKRRVVLMGGGPEADPAARDFVEAASGGDVLVLRASGSLTSYPSYFRDDLAPAEAPNSVETVKTNDPAAAAQAAVLCRIGNAEAIWLAGGNQANYLRGWPAAVHDALAAARDRGVAIGGTSAGSVSLGEAAFDAREGSVTSAEALADPFRVDVTLTYPTWAQPELDGTYVDSHFADRDREGRLLVFLARFMSERGRDRVVGIGLDEGMALVLEDGTYRVERSTRRGPGQRAWLYEVTGPATLAPGVPLTLGGIRRVGLAEGATGSWPLDFDGVPSTALDVVDGVVTEG